ncbi:hypothetical protein D9611_003310 [Ephemerocybe angulata]|uniref:Uncharacterized protein n=1 Tax=Ephemerocybe angulata TaxID=980116 RepID=A0A8H5C8Y7_9AGAR|nr:hypothetical protein D9611_003310 [Tulosesus angulatus]
MLAASARLSALWASTTLVLLCPVVVLAQIPVNGQIFTNGLSIINAPALNSEHNVGGNIPISIEVSGNGKLPSAALRPGSKLDTAYEEINIFLVSSKTNVNLTVTAGPNLLTDEEGSVRHFDYKLPSCIQPGQYNMTFYETSSLEKKALYVITPIPITIRNPSPSGSVCSEGVNALQAQPQEDACAPQSPFLPSGMGTSQTVWTVTMTQGGTLPTATPSDPSVTTVTMVIESPVLTTNGGETKLSTSTFTTTATMRSQDLSGFIPVTRPDNGAQTTRGRLPMGAVATFLLATVIAYV